MRVKTRIIQEVAFPEPDHQPEIEKQKAYVRAREGGRYAESFEGVDGDDEDVEMMGSGWHNTDNPSHARWAVERWGLPRCCKEEA